MGGNKKISELGSRMPLFEQRQPDQMLLLPVLQDGISDNGSVSAVYATVNEPKKS